ncbi:MAG: phosphate ABC transporter substrate-binding protein PstS [Crenarchaeota archaeon]|nr:phosphate ABC transporter substrate-binding protein PstS [Thermoproteota archaeon]
MDGRTLLILAAVAAVAVAAAVFLGGGGGEEQQGGQAGQVRLFGSGSTFVKPVMDRWAAAFRERTGVLVEYTGGGSGKGVSDILAGLVDFAASDPPLPRAKWERVRGRILQFPVVLGAVVVTYNVPEIGNVSLNFTGEVLAGIYMGEIRFWDDPAIKELNPAVADRLPHREIIAVHRSDASGTTEIFTLFLSKSCRRWAERVGHGKLVEWPVDQAGNGIGQEGNQGVTLAIKTNPYSIGYVEWAYALENGLPVARIANPSGRFVAPTRESIAAAFALDSPPSPADDWSSVAQRFVYSSASPDAYPIAGQTFLLVYSSYGSEAKCQAVKEFIRFIAGEGQDLIPKGYAPLPEQLRRVALQAADMIECGG